MSDQSQQENKSSNSGEQTSKWGIPKILRRILFSLLLLWLLFLAGLQLPGVQRYITNSIEDFLNEELQTHVEVDNFTMFFLNQIDLGKVLIEDDEQDL